MECGTVLFERDAENVESEEDSSECHEEIWDDSLLVEAYDRAVLLAKEKIAQKQKNVASIQNGNVSKSETESKEVSLGNTGKKSKKPLKPTSFNTWKVGMPCRTEYSEDGIEYEAIIIKMMDWKGKCRVRYVGYDNEEEVDIDKLKPWRGESARAQQMFEASCQLEMEEDADIQQVPDNFRSRFHGMNNTALPPPPPPHIMNNLPKSETEALSSMLMSWYMSGYHTGYYFGLANANMRDSEIQKMDSGRRFRKK